MLPEGSVRDGLGAQEGALRGLAVEKIWAPQDLRVNVAFIAQLQKWEKHLTGRSRPSLSLEEADAHDWCKCYFVMKDPTERKIVNLGQHDF